MVDSRSKSGKKSDRLGPPRSGAPARKGSIRLALVLVGLGLVNCYFFLWSDMSCSAVKKRAVALGDKPVPAAVIEGASTGSPPAVPAVAADVVEEPALPPITGEVAKGDTMGRLLKKHLSVSETDEVLHSLSDVFDYKTLRPGQKYSIERAADGSLQAFQLVISKVKTIRVERNADGVLVAVADEAQTRIEIQEVGGRIDSSLYASVKGAGENTELVAFFVDVFAYDLDFYVDTHEGDVFRVIVEKEYKDTEFLRYKRILAAEYDGRAGKFQAYWWKGSQHKGRYFDAKGRSVEKSLLKTPLKYARVSSGFNPKRMHPILHKVRGHFGVDYAAPTGTPVWAAASGTIAKRETNGGAGNHVVLKHDDGLQTTYMHLSKFAKNQKVGQRVEAKTVIGYVGTTGMSTGPHLHFGVKKNGAHIDPMKLAPTRARGVPKDDLAEFKAEIAALEARLAAIPIANKAAADVAATPDPVAVDVVN